MVTTWRSMREDFAYHWNQTSACHKSQPLIMTSSSNCMGRIKSPALLKMEETTTNLDNLFQQYCNVMNLWPLTNMTVNYATTMCTSWFVSRLNLWYNQFAEIPMSYGNFGKSILLYENKFNSMQILENFLGAYKPRDKLWKSLVCTSNAIDFSKCGSCSMSGYTIHDCFEIKYHRTSYLRQIMRLTWRTYSNEVERHPQPTAIPWLVENLKGSC